MEVGKLTVQLRQGSGKSEARRLRSQGMVPGVCYGAELDQPLPVIVDAKALKASLDPERGSNTVIEVTVRDGEKPAAELTALLWEYQIDPAAPDRDPRRSHRDRSRQGDRGRGAAGAGRHAPPAWSTAARSTSSATASRSGAGRPTSRSSSRST